MHRPELSTLRYPHLWQGCVRAWCPSQSGATGYRLLDYSGNSTHGTLTNMDPGTDWVPSSNKLALDFDGIDDYVSTNLPLGGESKLSISCWVNRASGKLIAFGNGANSGSRISLGGDDTGTYFSFENQFVVSYPYAAALTPNVWHNVVVVWNGELSGISRVTYYLNGVNKPLTSGGGLPCANLPTSFDWYIGRSGGPSETKTYTTGQVDDIRIYKRIITAIEAQQLSSGRGAAYQLKERGRKKAYVPGYRITAPSRIQTGSARTIDGTDTESLTRGLVGAWCPSLGASGYRLLDRSGNNNHGTLTNMDPGTDWVPSGGKLALDFDGVNDYVSTMMPGVIETNRSFSVWFKTAANLSNGQYGNIVRWGTATTFPSDNGKDFIGLFGTDANLGTNGFGVSQYGDGVAVAGLNDNKWHNGVIVNTGSLYSIYVDGLFRTSKTMTTNATAGTVVIGQFGTNIQYFNGQLDDIRIYKRALTPQEIRLLYTGGRGVGLLPEAKPKRARIVAWDNQDKISVPARVLTNTDSLKRGLVGHWSPSVSGPQGNRLMDLSGQNNHGTLTNMDYQTDYVPSAENGGRMALDFDGVDDRVVATKTIPYAHNNIVSIGCWARVSSTGGRTVLVNFGGSFELWYPLFDGGSTIALGYPGASPLQSVNNATVFDEWVHIFITRGGASSGLSKIYLNGNAVSLQTDTTANHPAITANTFIGCRDGATRFALAKIDDVRIYNRVLTPSEIRLLAQSRMPERATPQRTRTVFYSSGFVSFAKRSSRYLTFPG